jgi:hypothetical protein
VRFTASEEKPAFLSCDSYTEVQAKHPPRILQKDCLPDSLSFPSLSIDENSVRKADLSFPPESISSPDGLRSQHLKDLVQRREAGADILSAGQPEPTQFWPVDVPRT